MFFSLLAAAAVLPFACASPSELAGTPPLASPLVAGCFEGTACKYAAQAWKTCVNQPTTTALTTEELAHSCLCTNGPPSPSFVEWPGQLDTCIKCLENGTTTTVSDFISDSVVEYCHGSLTLEAFTAAAENLSVLNKFPICLPETVLDPSLTLSPSTFSQLNSPHVALRQTPAGTAWSSLPASLAMNACLGTTDCYFDRLVWEWCVEQIPGAATNSSITHECICNTWHTSWMTALEGCSTCIMEAGLPKNPSNQATSGFPNAVKEFADAYCGLAPTASTSILVRLGEALTNVFECPILFFNTTLLEAPVVPPKKARSLPLPVEMENLKRQTPAGTAWSSLPASPKMQACAASDGCCFARDVFDWCLNDIPGNGNNAITHNCLCNNYYTQWNDGVMSCTDCITEAGLPANPTKYNPSTFTYWVNYTMVDYCNHPQATIPQLLEIGNAMTNIFESPIALFNLTVLTQPIPFPKV